MISFELLLAISVYYFVMYATPGPNNSILTASGIKFGFIRTIPNIFGIPTGHGIQLALVCIGLGNLFIHFPTRSKHYRICVSFIFLFTSLLARNIIASAFSFIYLFTSLLARNIIASMFSFIHLFTSLLA